MPLLVCALVPLLVWHSLLRFSDFDSSNLSRALHCVHISLLLRFASFDWLCAVYEWIAHCLRCGWCVACCICFHLLSLTLRWRSVGLDCTCMWVCVCVATILIQTSVTSHLLSQLARECRSNNTFSEKSVLTKDKTS